MSIKSKSVAVSYNTQNRNMMTISFIIQRKYALLNTYEIKKGFHTSGHT